MANRKPKESHNIVSWGPYSFIPHLSLANLVFHASGGSHQGETQGKETTRRDPWWPIEDWFPPLATLVFPSPRFACRAGRLLTLIFVAQERPAWKGIKELISCVVKVTASHDIGWKKRRKSWLAIRWANLTFTTPFFGPLYFYRPYFSVTKEGTREK